MLQELNNYKDEQELLNAFYDFIEEETANERLKKKKPTVAEKLGRLYTVLPDYYHNKIVRKIDRHYNGNSEEYIKTIPLFMNLFKREDRNICESNVILLDKKEKRRFYKTKKQTMLWCSQLLGLAGAKTKELYLDNVLFDTYSRIQQEKELMAKRMRVMTASGRVSKILLPSERLNQDRMKTKRQLLVLDRFSEERGDMTWSFLTITLPPSFHSSPVYGESKFDGSKPEEVKKELTDIWARLRTALANAGFKYGVNEDLYGIIVFEGHKDGCLHRHILLHHRKSDTREIFSIFENQRMLNLKKYKKNNPDYTGDLQWKIELNNGKATATTYICKYIFPQGDKKGSDRNVALRSYYGIRGHSFFGVNECRHTFEYLCNNYQQFPAEVIGSDFYNMLKERDLYTFQKLQSVNCKKITETIEVKVKGEDDKTEPKEIFLGVEYVNPLTGETFIYRKKQNALIENFIGNDEEIIEFSDEEIDLGLLDLEERAEYNWNLMEDYHMVAVKKQTHYNTAMSQYLSKEIGKKALNSSMNKVYYIPELSEFQKSYTLDIKLSFEIELESNINHFRTDRKAEFIKEFLRKNEVEITIDDLKVMAKSTLNHLYSRKTEKPVPKALQEWCFEELLE